MPGLVNVPEYFDRYCKNVKRGIKTDDNGEIVYDKEFKLPVEQIKGTSIQLPNRTELYTIHNTYGKAPVFKFSQRTVNEYVRKRKNELIPKYIKLFNSAQIIDNIRHNKQLGVPPLICKRVATDDALKAFLIDLQLRQDNEILFGDAGEYSSNKLAETWLADMIAPYLVARNRAYEQARLINNEQKRQELIETAEKNLKNAYASARKAINNFVYALFILSGGRINFVTYKMIEEGCAPMTVREVPYTILIEQVAEVLKIAPNSNKRKFIIEELKFASEIEK